MLKKYFGDSTLSEIQLFEWHKAFSKGRVVIENLIHANRLSTSVNDETTKKFLENRRVSIREIAEETLSLNTSVIVTRLGFMNKTLKLFKI